MSPFATECAIAAGGAYLLGSSAFGWPGGLFFALIALTAVCLGGSNHETK